MYTKSIINVYIKNNESQPYSIVLVKRNRQLLFQNGKIFELVPGEFAPIQKQYEKPFLTNIDGCLGILQLSDYDHDQEYLVLIEKSILVNEINNISVYRITSVRTIPLYGDEKHEHIRLDDIRKLLSSGTFYYSRKNESINSFNYDKSVGTELVDFDITLCAQRRVKTTQSDNRIFWNKLLFIKFLKHYIDTDFWLDKIMCGFIDIKKIAVNISTTLTVVLISRIWCQLPGMPFQIRGLSDRGEAGNSIETEQAIYVKDVCSSYIQIRGSVPLFWDQIPQTGGGNRIFLTRGFELSHIGFLRHLQKLYKNYGPILLLNVLNENVNEEMVQSSEDAETFLSHEYFRHYHKLSSQIKENISYMQYNMNKEYKTTQNNNTLPFENLERLYVTTDEIPYLKNIFVYQAGGTLISEQDGIIRTNCFDCLNRTNQIQTLIGQYYANKQMESIQRLFETRVDFTNFKIDGFQTILNQMWTKNGTELSKFYLSNNYLARIVCRYAELMDESKQETISLFLANTKLNRSIIERTINILPPVLLSTSSEDTIQQICSRYDEFAKVIPINICCASYNVGGKKFSSTMRKDNFLEGWLMPQLRLGTQMSQVCDLYVIGFQEIVDLKAKNVLVRTDKDIQTWWKEIKKTLDRFDEFCLVSYCQMMGICLFVFVKAKYAVHVSEVNADVIKTGFCGLVGNKGCVAIRFLFYQTSLCFICAHLAAGQEMIHERNKNYNEIMNNLKFPQASSIDVHDYIFFMGDLNYRIDMDEEKVKKYILNRQYDYLQKFDQLLKYKRRGVIFRGFNEGPIKFAPTYKYDVHSTVYDSTTKQRIPSWCDRILWKYNAPDAAFVRPNSVGHQQSFMKELYYYGRAEFRYSDHRPICGLFHINMKKIAPKLFRNVHQNIILRNGPVDCMVFLQKTQESKLSTLPISHADVVQEVIEKMSLFGQVVMIRFRYKTIIVTFMDSTSALAAVSNLKTLTVKNITFTLSLSNPRWLAIACKEIEFGVDNTVSLVSRIIKADLDFTPTTAKNKITPISSTMRRKSSLDSNDISVLYAPIKKPSTTTIISHTSNRSGKVSRIPKRKSKLPTQHNQNRHQMDDELTDTTMIGHFGDGTNNSLALQQQTFPNEEDK